jgi:hypothetical protein
MLLLLLLHTLFGGNTWKRHASSVAGSLLFVVDQCRERPGLVRYGQVPYGVLMYTKHAQEIGNAGAGGVGHAVALLLQKNPPVPPKRCPVSGSARLCFAAVCC